MTNIEIRVRSTYDDLGKAEKKVADYFLKNMETIFHLPIAQLASDANTSQVAWVRFAKSIGFAGLKELKKAIFLELNAIEDADEEDNSIFTDIKDFPDINAIKRVIRTSSTQAVEDTISLLDSQVISDVSDKIIAAESVKIFGVGASAIVAEDFYCKLLRIGKNVSFSSDIHVQLTYAANAGPKDVLLFISHSGYTSEIVEMADIIKQIPAITISLTKFSKNPLAQQTDYQLYTASPETDYRSGAMSSRIAQMVVIDTLFTVLANRNYDNIIDNLQHSYEVCHKHRVK